MSAFCALSMTIAACGKDSDSSGSSTSAATVPTTAAPTTTAVDPCAGVTLEATETGVSADTITVVVMADVGSELAPGLFQGSIDGTEAWAKAVNAAGGLGCRQVQVIEWDSKLSPTESTNGFLEACSKALALVGSTSLFIGDVSIINTCLDAAGAATGIADIAERAVDAVHQCSPNLFSTGGVAGSCPYEGTGVRDYRTAVGVALPFLPFEERAENTEVDTFLTAIGDDFPPSWAVGAWNAGRALEVAVNKIMSTDGPNGITRAKVLETLRTITDFDSSGWIGTVDFSRKALSPCFVLHAPRPHRAHR